MMTTPDLAVILVTDTARRIAPVLESIRQSGAQCRLEIIVIAPTGTIFDPADGLRIIERESIYPLTEARAAGIRAALAPAVFMGETHSFPRPEMFDLLEAALRAGATMAVPVFENENPPALVSWAGLINGYAFWLAGQPGGRLARAPLFNAAYDRAFLLGLGHELGTILAQGEEMMARIRAARGEIRLEPAARIGHTNFAQTGPWLRQRLVAGRVIASVRSEHWSRLRRIAYALGAPLIPVVLLRRYRDAAARVISQNELSPALWPVLTCGLASQAAGEMLGYAFGRSPAAERCYDTFEVQQTDYV